MPLAAPSGITVGGAEAPTLFARALHCLRTTDPDEKLALTQIVAATWLPRLAAGEHPAADSPPESITTPGRPDCPHLVPPRDVPQRKLSTVEGRAALLHAVVHIEFNAINLAWDAVYRFRDMPSAYYADFIGVAADEARHFAMLRERLRALGRDYGDFDAHNGLWEMALKTAHDVTARMALVPRLLEARGLDVTPGMIARLRSVGDSESAEVLEIILREEVAHVAAGTRWFEHGCATQGLEPVETFRNLVETHASGAVRPPLNLASRRAAGFSDAELAAFAGRPV